MLKSRWQRFNVSFGKRSRWLEPSQEKLARGNRNEVTWPDSMNNQVKRRSLTRDERLTSSSRSSRNFDPTGERSSQLGRNEEIIAKERKWSQAGRIRCAEAFNSERRRDPDEILIGVPGIFSSANVKSRKIPAPDQRGRMKNRNALVNRPAHQGSGCFVDH